MPIKLLLLLNQAQSCLYSPKRVKVIRTSRWVLGRLVYPPQIPSPPLPSLFGALRCCSARTALVDFLAFWLFPGFSLREEGKADLEASFFNPCAVGVAVAWLGAPRGGSDTSRASLPTQPSVSAGSRLSAYPGFKPSRLTTSRFHHMTYIFPPSCPNLCRQSFY